MGANPTVEIQLSVSRIWCSPPPGHGALHLQDLVLTVSRTQCFPSPGHGALRLQDMVLTTSRTRCTPSPGCGALHLQDLVLIVSRTQCFPSPGHGALHLQDVVLSISRTWCSSSPGHSAHHLQDMVLSISPASLGFGRMAAGCCGRTSSSQAPRELQPPALPRAALPASSTPIKSQSSSRNWPLFSHSHKCPKHLLFRLKFPMFNLRPKENVCGGSLSKFPSSICNLSAKKEGKQTLFLK